ncbi:hypothetical protein C4585_02390 [Candidatus Parcubacteria bacterium]|nr:MAG: hypothetical protein C4585_02390 [Candidatus Parcubacteria bacterium]
MKIPQGSLFARFLEETEMSEVSRKDLEKIVGANGKADRIHIDLSEDVFEHVQLVGFDPVSLTAKECRHLSDCSAGEVKILKRALGANRIARRPCVVGKQTFQIAVMC